MFKRLFSGSRMTRECPVRFYEGLSGKFRGSTHQLDRFFNAKFIQISTILFGIIHFTELVPAAANSAEMPKFKIVTIEPHRYDKAALYIYFLDERNQLIERKYFTIMDAYDYKKNQVKLPIQPVTIKIVAARMDYQTYKKSFTAEEIARLDTLSIGANGDASVTMKPEQQLPSVQTLQETLGNTYPGVKKINNDLYVGKVADEFYVAMERVGEENIGMWTTYADQQLRKGNRIVPLTYLPNTDGSGHFSKVLDWYKNELSKRKPIEELWVVYASRTPVVQMARLYGDESPSIEMFFTVITSPNALIASHMGISRTLEAARDLQEKPPRRKRHQDQSVHLHSFAAKVMKMLDPKKVYMLTAPASIMREILVKKMPVNSVFIGDNLYQKKLEKIEKDPTSVLDKYDLEFVKNETQQEYEKRIKDEVEHTFTFNKYREKISQLKTNPPRIVRGDWPDETFILLNPGGTNLVQLDLYTYGWMFTPTYRDRGTWIPYVLVDLSKLAAVVGLQP